MDKKNSDIDVVGHIVNDDVHTFFAECGEEKVLFILNKSQLDIRVAYTENGKEKVFEVKPNHNVIHILDLKLKVEVRPFRWRESRQDLMYKDTKSNG